MLLNVRLKPEDEKIVRGLRKARVNISELVRKAIRDRAEFAKPASRLELLDEIIGTFPSSAKDSRLPPLDDRNAMAKAMVRAIRRKRR